MIIIIIIIVCSPGGWRLVADSFGMVLWEMWARRVPYEKQYAENVGRGAEVPRAYIADVGTGWRPALPSNVPPAWLELIHLCWHQVGALSRYHTTRHSRAADRRGRDVRAGSEPETHVRRAGERGGAAASHRTRAGRHRAVPGQHQPCSGGGGWRRRWCLPVHHHRHRHLDGHLSHGYSGASLLLLGAACGPSHHAISWPAAAPGEDVEEAEAEAAIKQLNLRDVY